MWRSRLSRVLSTPRCRRSQRKSGALSALFIIQALKRYEDQSVFAFFLALWAWPCRGSLSRGNLAGAASYVATIETSSPRSRDSPRVRAAIDSNARTMASSDAAASFLAGVVDGALR
jgi:hypothetical protein